MSLTQLTAREAVARLARGEVSPLELVEAALLILHHIY